MTKIQMVTECRTLLNEPSAANSQFTDVMLLEGLNQGYLLVAAKCGLNQSSATASSVAGQALYAMPADVLTIIGLKYKDPDVSGAKFAHLTVKTIEELNRQFDGWEDATAGVPGYYYRSKRTVVGLYPPPKSNGAGNIKIYYRERPTLLSADGDIPDLPVEAHILPCYYAVFRALMVARDPSAGGFKTLFEQGLNELEIEQETWSEDELTMTWG